MVKTYHMTQTKCFVHLGKHGDLMILMPGWKRIFEATGDVPWSWFQRNSPPHWRGCPTLEGGRSRSDWYGDVGDARKMAEKEFGKDSVLVPKWWDDPTFTPPAIRKNAASLVIHGRRMNSNVNTYNVGEADLVLPSSPPEIQSVVATSNGIPVYNVAPGTTVQVTVTATGQNLNYEWYDTNGLTSLPNSSNISWTIPANASGFQYLWARVNDGAGGYAEQRVELEIVPFAFMDGVVIGSDTGARFPARWLT